MSERLNPKSSAPDLIVPLVSGGKFDVSESKPEKFTILVVYRGVHCPKCKAQLKEIDGVLAGDKADGFNVVAVSMDTEERALKAISEWELKNLKVGYDLPLLTAKAYGLYLSDAISENESKMFTEPGIFVIHPDGALYALYVQNTPFGRVPLQEILGGLTFAFENDYPTRGTSIG